MKYKLLDLSLVLCKFCLSSDPYDRLAFPLEVVVLLYISLVGYASASHLFSIFQIRSNLVVANWGTLDQSLSRKQNI
jgi:hypothetical protein